MRRGVLLCLTALLLTGCAETGLPRAREMGNAALLRTMGVDPGRDGAVAVTVSTGRRASGIQGEEKEDALVLKAERPSLSGACLAVQGLSDSYVFYGYVDQLLLGEAQAEAGLLPVLRYFSEDAELGLGAGVWLVRGGTAEAAVRSGGDGGVERRLSTLTADGDQGAASITRTAGDTLTALLEDGAAYLPALIPSEGENVTLLERGYGVVTQAGLSGWLDGEAARGLELLESRELSDVLELELPAGRAVVRVTGAETAVSPVCSGRGLTGLEVVCRVQAELAEGVRALDRQELAQVTAALEERETARMEETVRALQSWGTDCLRLGRRAALAAPSLRKAAAAGWSAQFSALTVNIRAEGSIRQK